jgi:hypothetical protein
MSGDNAAFRQQGKKDFREGLDGKMRMIPGNFRETLL